MGARTASLERQHEHARTRLAQCESALTEAGVPAEAMQRHPEWRSLRADCRTITRRLNRAREIEKLNESESDA